jgi:hypothetical protein
MPDMLTIIDISFHDTQLNDENHYDTQCWVSLNLSKAAV